MSVTPAIRTAGILAVTRAYIGRHLGACPVTGEHTLDVRTSVALWDGDPERLDLLAVVDPSAVETPAARAGLRRRLSSFDVVFTRCDGTPAHDHAAGAPRELRGHLDVEHGLTGPYGVREAEAAHAAAHDVARECCGASSTYGGHAPHCPGEDGPDREPSALQEAGWDADDDARRHPSDV